MSAIMPESHVKRTRAIGQMAEGESGFTVPWALALDKEGRAYLRGDYDIGERGGTRQVLVTRESRWGWVVDLTHCPRETWERGGASHFHSVPVAQIRGA